MALGGSENSLGVLALILARSLLISVLENSPWLHPHLAAPSGCWGPGCGRAGGTRSRRAPRWDLPDSEPAGSPRCARRELKAWEGGEISSPKPR